MPVPKGIGKFPIDLSESGRIHPMFGHFGKRLDVGHWHNDMPGLTERSVVLATSEGCPRQIVKYAPLVFGLQCHMEFTQDLIELLIAASHRELSTLDAHSFVQPPETLRSTDWSAMNALLHVFLDKLSAAYEGTCGSLSPRHSQAG